MLIRVKNIKLQDAMIKNCPSVDSCKYSQERV